MTTAARAEDVFDRLATAESDTAWTDVADLLAEHWTVLLFRTDLHATVVRLLLRLPEEELRRQPAVAFMAAAVGRHLPFSHPLALPSDDAGIHRSLKSDDARRLIGLAAHAIAAHRAAGRVVDAWALTGEALPLVKASTTMPYSPGTDLAAYWYLQAGWAALLVGQFAKAYLYFSIGWDYRTHDATAYAASHLAAGLCFVTSLMGDSREVERWGGAVEELRPLGSTLIGWEGAERTRALALLLDALDRLDREAAEPLTRALTSRLAFDPLWSVTLVALVRHHVADARTEEAARLIAVTVEMHSTELVADGLHMSMVAVARADLALVLGQGAEMERALAHMTGRPLPPVAALYGARLALSVGDHERARRLARSAEQPGVFERIVQESRALRGAAELALGHRDEAARLVGSKGVFTPVNRRTLALIPARLHALMREELGLGEELPPPNPLMSVDSSPRVVRLTESEQRVLHQLTGPAPLAQIAERLFITRNTLKSHLRKLYAKLGATSREEAVTFAVDLGLMPAPSDS